MKTVKRIFLFIFIGAVFTACKKEQLPPTTIENQPVFYFTGTINSNTLSWQAGVNNYYMYSTYSQNDSTGVYSFNGTLQNTATGNNSIQIIINDYRASQLNAAVTSAHIDSALSPAKTYGYFTGLPISDTSYLVTFTPKIYYGTPTSLTYSFGDLSPNVTTTLDTALTHRYSARKYYNTSLNVDFSSACGNIYMSNPLNILKTTPSFMIDSISSVLYVGAHDSIAFTTAVSHGTSPYSYKFYFGDGDSTIVNSVTTTLSTIHTYTTTATFPVKLQVKDANNDTASYNYTVSTDTTPPCRFDYTMSSPVQNIMTNSKFLSQITIIYTNSAGVVYTSKSNSQAGSFQINSVSDYQTNTSGYPTKMLKVNFSCSLYNSAATPSVVIANNCTATIAVAYP